MCVSVCVGWDVLVVADGGSASSWAQCRVMTSLVHPAVSPVGHCLPKLLSPLSFDIEAKQTKNVFARTTMPCVHGEVFAGLMQTLKK